MRLSIAIPCFNEAPNVRALEERLASVLPRLLADWSTLEIVLVDDGSRDDTAEAMRAFAAAATRPGLDVVVRRHEQNAGLGAAIRTGLSTATGDVVVTTDADGTYRFSDIPALLACLTPGVDLVTASPYHPQGAVENVPSHRLFLSRGASLLYRLLVRWRFYTWTALFRAYRRPVIETVPFASDGFLAGTEILVNAIAAGFVAAEFPAVLHARTLGTSKAKLLRTIRAHLRFQGSLLLRRVTGHAPEGRPAGHAGSRV